MTGGAFGSILAQVFHLTAAERKTLLVAGAASGMSAVFATPIAATSLAVAQFYPGSDRVGRSVALALLLWVPGVPDARFFGLPAAVSFCEDEKMIRKTTNIQAALRRHLFLTIGATAALTAWMTPASAQAQNGRWDRLTNQPTFMCDTALLLTDGRVMVHQYGDPNHNGQGMNNWWALTPDANGSYLNGTWSQLASMSSSYGPLYFASAVLPDGRVIVEGGEYNFLIGVETNQGAIYNPVTNIWTTVNPPVGWSQIGDAPGAVLDNGTFTIGDIFSRRQVLFNATTLTWTTTGTGKVDNFSEEGFCKLPSGKLLLVDTANATNSELYDPATGQWTSAGSTIVRLPDPSSLEIGPHIQRPNGTSVAFGGTVHNAIYTFSTGTWTAATDFPNGNDMADAPCAVLPNGNVLVATSPGIFQTPVTFFTFDGTTFTQAPATQTSGSLTSYQERFLLLPTGQVLSVVADGLHIDAELFTGTGRPDPAWRPNITSVPTTLTRGTSVQISGTQFNGLSVGSDYGDDCTNATNYPIVRLTNGATRHVFYARTHDHSTMGIATGNTIVSTTMDIPSNMETGPSRIEVIANGIPSRPRLVTVQ
jgi:Voltage gated chloride channel